MTTSVSGPALPKLVCKNFIDEGSATCSDIPPRGMRVHDDADFPDACGLAAACATASAAKAKANTRASIMDLEGPGGLQLHASCTGLKLEALVIF